ncbi:hypothetical protein [Minwuia sp.]|uniref:FliH/SctL family protein n=1 Tax=Minwuia sp. TaxID=2493630 RepID=UPI003A8E5568
MSEKFLFDQEFDESGRPRRAARAETFGEDDLNAARAQAFAEGQEEGARSASATIEATAADILNQVAEQLQTLSGQFDGFAQGWRAQASAIAVAVGQKLAHRLMQDHPIAEIEAMVADCVAELHEEPRLVIRTSDPVAEVLRERLDDIAGKAGFDGHLVLLPDQQMNDQDCRVEWADGGVVRDQAETESKINRAVEAFVASPSPQGSMNHV